MSITDDLRKAFVASGGAFVASTEITKRDGNIVEDCMVIAKSKLGELCDAIDAEHDRQLEVLYRDMSDAEYVKLHKDTGGEYIQEHDKVDWRDHAGTWHENATVVAVCNDGCYVMDGTVFHVHKSDIRHHHAPTVEDLLRRFMVSAQALDCIDEEDELVSEYASKLRLAEGEDA